MNLSDPSIDRDKNRSWIDRCEENKLMYQDIEERNGTQVTIAGKQLQSFTNCSYLGFDTDLSMIEAAKATLDEWGLHYCCARSRLTIGPIVSLETKLTQWFGAPALTFPSVTSTHSSVLPVLSSQLPRARFIFDRFAHASMQILKPILTRKAAVVTIAHNDMTALEAQVVAAVQAGETPVYCADSVYSMGGSAPLQDILDLAEDYPLVLYLDDAHGTSIYGPQGQGFVAEHLNDRPWPKCLWMTFSLAKGFGCNGGGIVCPTAEDRTAVKRFGQTFAFSGPIDFAMAGAALKGLELHQSPVLKEKQKLLRQKVARVDEILFAGQSLPFSPIRMIDVGDEHRAIDLGCALRDLGFYVPVVFYPVVPRGEAQLRLCVTVHHEEHVLIEFCHAVKELMRSPKFALSTRRDIDEPLSL